MTVLKFCSPKTQALFSNPDQLTINGPPVAVAGRDGNLYYLPAPEVTNELYLSAQRSSSDNSLLSWHRRLAHPKNLRALKKLLKHHHITSSPMNEEYVVRCEICVQGKMHQSRFTLRSEHRATEVGGIIHSDLASFPVTACEGFKYYVSFIDDYSKSLLLIC